MSFLTGLFLPIEVTTNWSAQRCRGLRFAQGPQGRHRHGSPEVLPALVHGQPSALGCVLCQAGCQQPRLLSDSPSRFCCSVVLFIFISNSATSLCPAFSSSPRPFIFSGFVFPQSQDWDGATPVWLRRASCGAGLEVAESQGPLITPARTAPFWLLARCFLAPGREWGQVLPCCEAFLAKKPLGAQPWLCTAHSAALACGENAGLLRPFQMSVRTLG